MWKRGVLVTVFTSLVVFTSTVAFSSLVTLAPLRTVAELAVATIIRIVSIIIVRIRVIIAVAAIILGAAGQYKTGQEGYSTQNDLSFLHSNHSLSLLNLIIPCMRYNGKGDFLKRFGDRVRLHFYS